MLNLANEIDGNVFDPITFGYTAGNKSGLSKRNRMEITASGQLSEKVTLSSSTTFTDSKELEVQMESISERSKTTSSYFKFKLVMAPAIP